MMKLRSLKNESGIAAIIMVIAALIVISLVGINFVIEQENKHQGSAVSVNAEQAQANAEAGWRFAQKCLVGNDPNCPCNTGPPNNCLDWINMVDFPTIGFGGTGGSFQASFSNASNCSIEIASVGIANNTRRTINDILTRSSIGAAGVVSVANSQSVLGPTIPPIAVLNPQSNHTTTDGNSITFPNYVVPGGSNLVLVVMAGSEAGGNNALPSGVTFGGTPMTLADRGVSFGGGSDPGVGLFYLPVAAGANGNVVATFQGNTQNRMVSIITLSNALSPPEAVEFTNMGNANVPQVDDNITTLSTNAMIISAAYYKLDNDLFAVNAGHNEITGFNNPAGEAEGAMGSQQAGAPGVVAGVGYRRWPFGGFGFTSDNMVQVLAAFPHANRTISMNYTVPAGNSQILVVVAGAEDGINPTFVGGTVPISATFNGNPMTLVNNTRVNSVGFEAGLGMFWMPVNSGDTGTITVTYTDSSIDDNTLHAYTLNDAAGPPVALAPVTSTSPTDISTNFAVNLPAGSMIASGGYQGNNTGITATLPLAGAHVANSVETSLGSSSTGVMGSMPVPATTMPMGVGFRANFNRMALILASFPPTGGGPCL